MRDSGDNDKDSMEAAKEEKRETRLLLSKAKYFTFSWIGALVFLVLAYVIYKQMA